MLQGTGRDMFLIIKVGVVHVTISYKHHVDACYFMFRKFYVGLRGIGHRQKSKR
jgi:hypothetical protein